ncbi:alpha/beta fold hydrolase [Catenulispora subtropica]|uniref:Alpha/beta fold hydrolase n=2 Tax=Catenulispora subtropica TaxID=450798 RepID=A0ABN2RA57_9ACTN
MSCWEGWAKRFATHGYAVSVPGWPGEDDDVRRARRDPGPLRDLGLPELTEHYARLVRGLERPPVLIGHAVGGLIAQHLLGADLAEAAVAIAPQPPPGVPAVETRPSLASQIWGPPVGHDGVVPLPRSQFRHVVANAVGEEEAAELFARYAMPAPQRLLDDPQSALAVDTDNPARGPLLLVSGQEDRLVPDAATRSVYKLYGDSPAATDLKQFADRGHSLVADSGWPQVADHVLGWLSDNGVRATEGHRRFM